MKTKNTLLVILVLLISLNFAACGKEQKEIKAEEVVKTVKVQEVVESEDIVQLDYIGTVNSKSIVKYSFKSPGKLKKIYVEKGEKVKKGDKLAELDTQDLEFAVTAAKFQTNTAKTQYDKALNGAQEEEINRIEQDVKKAQDSYDYIVDLYDDMKKLYEEGIISESKFKEVKLKKDNTEAVLNQAKEGLKQIEDGARQEDIDAAMNQYLTAKTSYEQKLSLLEDAIIYAKHDGSVVELPFEENELLAQGYPVVVIRSNQQVVNVGIAQKDLNNIKIGTKAIIDIDGVMAEAEITNIDEAPDLTTRTYNAEVTVKEKIFRIGSIAKVKFDIGKEKGLWIPINSVMANGEDYVYIAKDGRAFKKNINLGKIHGNNVMITGIQSGDKLVVEGMKNLKDGCKVNVANMNLEDDKKNENVSNEKDLNKEDTKE